MEFIKKPELKPLLETRHPHQRDAYIHFEEKSHTYTIDLTSPHKPYTSVTTWIHTLFPSFDADKIINNMMRSKNWPKSRYFGLNKDEIKASWETNRDQAATSGTNMHFLIECFYNLESDQQRELMDRCSTLPISPDTLPVEFSYFLKYENELKDHEILPEYDLTPYRTEWTIFDEELFMAGSVDMIYKCRKTGELVIADWKRSKEIKKTNAWESAKVECISHIPNSNFWHYSLQLNLYKYILEKCYGEKVVELFLVCLHPDNPNKGYIRYKVPILYDEIESLIEYRKQQIIEK